MSNNESTPRRSNGMNKCANPENVHYTIYSSEDGLSIGMAAICRGPVASGDLALLRGETYKSNYIARVFYYCEGGRKFVRLERFGLEGGIESHPRSEVQIVGQVVCFRRWEEPCEECLAMRTRESEARVRRVLGKAHAPGTLSPRAQAAKKREGGSRERTIRRKVEEMDWPDYIDEGGAA